MNINKTPWIACLLAFTLLFSTLIPITLHAEPLPITSSLATPHSVKTISDARQLSNDETITIKGTITSVIGNNAFIQDDGAGMYLYGGKTHEEAFVPGNTLIVTGVIDDYNGLKQLKDMHSITVVDRNMPLPSPKELTTDQLGDAYEGTLVALKNMTIKNIVSSYRDYNMTLLNENGQEATVRISGYLEPNIDISNLLPGVIIDVIGPLSQYKNNYQIMPTKETDITLITKTSHQPLTVKIPEIQGTSHKSPYENQDVKDVTGVVTAVVNTYFDKGFYMQDTLTPNHDLRQSNGIYVDLSQARINVKVGDTVSVYGTVKEAYAAPQSMRSGNLTVTQLQARTINVLAHDQPLPPPVIIGEGGRIPPANVDATGLDTFDTIRDAIDFYESIESMRVLIKDAVVTGVAEKYGEIAVLPNKGQLEENRTHTGGVRITDQHYPTSRLLIDDVLVPLTNKQKHFISPEFDVKVGDVFSGDIIAIGTYGFGEFKFLNTEVLPPLLDGGNRRKPTILNPKEDHLTIAEYNIENFSVASTSAEKTARLGESFVNDLKKPDIIALVEVQDDDGPKGNNGLVDATKSGQALIDAIHDVDPDLQYKYVDIPPVDNMDGGQPGANIRVGYLYNPDRVTLVDKGDKGGQTEEATLTDTGLTKNPMRLGTQSQAFLHTRKSLVAEFEFQGEKVFIITNHFSSKRGDDPVYGDTQPANKGSEVNRHKQASLIHEFVTELKSTVKDAMVVVVGDMNDYEFSKTISILKGSDTLYNKVEDIPLDHRYNYVHAGVSQVLDNALVTPNLKNFTTVDFVNINAEFTEHHGRTSDHDPLLLQLDVKSVLKANHDTTNPEDQGPQPAPPTWELPTKEALYNFTLMYYEYIRTYFSHLLSNK